MTLLYNELNQFSNGEGTPLAGGKLFFYITGTGLTPLPTYSDSTLNNLNPNPVQLDGEGRPPNDIWGDGVYKVILTDQNNVQIGVGPIVGGDPGSRVAFNDYNPTIIYNENNIVEYDDLFYLSLADGNLNNQPDISPVSWQQISFLSNTGQTFNLVTQSAGDSTAGRITKTGDAGWLVPGRVSDNQNQASDFDLAIDSGSYFITGTTLNGPNGTTTERGTLLVQCESADNTDLYCSQIFTERATGRVWVRVSNAGVFSAWGPLLSITVQAQIGGGTLLIGVVNEIRDSSTYTLPLANSVPANTQITFDLPERYRAAVPVVQIAGADVIISSAGGDSSITYDGETFGRIYLTSDGISSWSI